jgi:hypothetical protein
VIYIYEGRVNCGKTRQMIKDFYENRKSNFILIDEGEIFIRENPDFDFSKYELNGSYHDLFITFQKTPKEIKKLRGVTIISMESK